jgi:hypothetical protein
VSLSGFRGGGEKTENYISQHCVVGTRKSSGKIPIKNVRDISLRTVLFTITRVVGSVAPHLATNSQMQYVVDCMAPTIFNWCEGILESMKDQLTKCKIGRLKQFGYGSILVSFFLERVPLLRLQSMELDEDPDPQEPHMKRWVDMMDVPWWRPNSFV